MTSTGAVGPVVALRGITVHYRIYEPLLKDPRDMGVLNMTCVVSLTPMDPFRPDHTPCLQIPRSCIWKISVHLPAQCLTRTRELVNRLTSNYHVFIIVDTFHLHGVDMWRLPGPKISQSNLITPESPMFWI